MKQEKIDSNNHNNQTQNELDMIKKAQQGDQDSIEKLCNQYKSVVVGISRKFFIIGGELDDLAQEGMIGLYKAILSYNHTQKGEFKYYAKMLIERQLINAIKSDQSLKNSPLNDRVWTDDNEQDDFSYLISAFSKNDNPENTMLSREKNQSFLAQISKILSDYEKSILKYYLKGFNYTDIADILKVSTKSVDNALVRIKNKLKQLKDDN